MQSLVCAVALGCAGASFGQCCESTYQFVPTPLTWHQARANAIRLGGQLVCIGNATEDALVKSIVPANTTYWIGFTDEVTEGQWAWVSNEPVGYTNWQPGEPNDFGLGEDYAFASTYPRTGWVDAPETQQYHLASVVEFPSPFDPDLNNDGFVNGQDLALVLGYWGPCQSAFCPGDADGSGAVDASDLALVLGAWTG